ncbi:MAG: pyruvate kinase [bacterium]
MYIIATISRKQSGTDAVKHIINAGANVLRYNFAYGEVGETLDAIKKDRAIIKALKVANKVFIMADLPGSKIRLGKIENDELFVGVGDEVCFMGQGGNFNDCTATVPVNTKKLGLLVKNNSIITIGDGEIALRVSKVIDDNSFVATVLNSGTIISHKALNVGGGIDSLDHLSQMRNYFDVVAEIKPDWVALSFVSDDKYVAMVRSELNSLNPKWNPKIVSKIESPAAVKNINKIINSTDMVIVARGDLGLSCDISKLGIYQKQIISLANEMGKKVFVSTQVLNSILSAYVPHRSEVLDVTNIFLDGADGVMLVDEIVKNTEPQRAVLFIKEVAKQVKKYINHGKNR